MIYAQCDRCDRRTGVVDHGPVKDNVRPVSMPMGWSALSAYGVIEHVCDRCVRRERERNDR